MANEEHLAILKQGVDACNQWRADSLEFSPDLSGADLSKAVLVRADFQRTDLSDANLRGANLNHATLYLANLARANLSRTWLPGVDLTYANLIGTNLVQAYLARADLYLTNLRGANLSRANIREANLSRANLDGAELRGIELGFTALADIDLSVANGVESVVHGYPSSVGVDTLALTLRGAGGRFTEEQLVFFESAGVPHTLLEYLPGILEAKPLKFFRCFISYSTDDEPFAEQLNSDLNKAGIQTWKWDRDAVRGRDLHQSIDWAIRQYDKTILICSGNSLNSPRWSRRSWPPWTKRSESKPTTRSAVKRPWPPESLRPPWMPTC